MRIHSLPFKFRVTLRVFFALSCVFFLVDGLAGYKANYWLVPQTTLPLAAAIAIGFFLGGISWLLGRCPKCSHYIQSPYSRMCPMCRVRLDGKESVQVRHSDSAKDQVSREFAKIVAKIESFNSNYRKLCWQCVAGCAVIGLVMFLCSPPSYKGSGVEFLITFGALLIGFKVAHVIHLIRFVTIWKCPGCRCSLPLEGQEPDVRITICGRCEIPLTKVPVAVALRSVPVQKWREVGSDFEGELCVTAKELETRQTVSFHLPDTKAVMVKLVPELNGQRLRFKGIFKDRDVLITLNSSEPMLRL